MSNCVYLYDSLSLSKDVPFSQAASVVTWNVSGSKHLSEHLDQLIRSLCSQSTYDQLKSCRLFQRAVASFVLCSPGKKNENIENLRSRLLEGLTFEIKASLVEEWTRDVEDGRTMLLCREEICSSSTPKSNSEEIGRNTSNSLVVKKGKPVHSHVAQQATLNCNDQVSSVSDIIYFFKAVNNCDSGRGHQVPTSTKDSLRYNPRSNSTSSARKCDLKASIMNDQQSMRFFTSISESVAARTSSNQTMQTAVVGKVDSTWKTVPSKTMTGIVDLMGSSCGDSENLAFATSIRMPCWECRFGKFRRAKNGANFCRDVLRHIGPDYESLQSEGSSLESSINTLCAAPSSPECRAQNAKMLLPISGPKNSSSSSRMCSTEILEENSNQQVATELVTEPLQTNKVLSSSIRDVDWDRKSSRTKQGDIVTNPGVPLAVTDKIVVTGLAATLASAFDRASRMNYSNIQRQNAAAPIAACDVPNHEIESKKSSAVNAGISNSSSISVTKKSVSASPAIISASEYKLGEQISNENQIFQPLLAVSVLNRPISFQPFVPSIFESQPLDPSNFESLTATSKADSNTKSSGANVVGTPGPEMVPECKQLFVFGVGSGIWLRGHQKDHQTLKQIVAKPQYNQEKSVDSSSENSGPTRKSTHIRSIPQQVLDSLLKAPLGQRAAAGIALIATEGIPVFIPENVSLFTSNLQDTANPNSNPKIPMDPAALVYGKIVYTSTPTGLRISSICTSGTISKIPGNSFSLSFGDAKDAGDETSRPISWVKYSIKGFIRHAAGIAGIDTDNGRALMNIALQKNSCPRKAIFLCSTSESIHEFETKHLRSYDKIPVPTLKTTSLELSPPANISAKEPQQQSDPRACQIKGLRNGVDEEVEEAASAEMPAISFTNELGLGCKRDFQSLKNDVPNQYVSPEPHLSGANIKKMDSKFSSEGKDSGQTFTPNEEPWKRMKKHHTHLTSDDSKQDTLINLEASIGADQDSIEKCSTQDDKESSKHQDSDHRENETSPPTREIDIDGFRLVLVVQRHLAISAHQSKFMRPHLHTLHGDGGLLSCANASNSEKGSDPFKLSIGSSFFMYGCRDVKALKLEGSINKESSIVSYTACDLNDIDDECQVLLCVTDLPTKNETIYLVCKPSTKNCECLDDAGPRALARWISIPGCSADQNVPWLRRRLLVVEQIQDTFVSSRISGVLEELFSSKFTDSTSTSYCSETVVSGIVYKIEYKMGQNQNDKTTRDLSDECSSPTPSQQLYYWQNDRPTRSTTRTIFYGISPPSTPVFQRSKRRRLGRIQSEQQQNPPPGGTKLNSNATGVGLVAHQNLPERDPLIGQTIWKTFSTGRFRGSVVKRETVRVPVRNKSRKSFGGIREFKSADQYLVRYVDGDSEHLSRQAIQRLLLMPSHSKFKSDTNSEGSTSGNHYVEVEKLVAQISAVTVPKKSNRISGNETRLSIKGRQLDPVYIDSCEIQEGPNETSTSPKTLSTDGAGFQEFDYCGRRPNSCNQQDTVQEALFSTSNESNEGKKSGESSEVQSRSDSTTKGKVASLGRRDSHAAESLIMLRQYYDDLVAFVEDIRRLHEEAGQEQAAAHQNRFMKLRPEFSEWDKDPIMKWANGKETYTEGTLQDEGVRENNDLPDLGLFDSPELTLSNAANFQDAEHVSSVSDDSVNSVESTVLFAEEDKKRTQSVEHARKFRENAPGQSELKVESTVLSPSVSFDVPGLTTLCNIVVKLSERANLKRWSLSEGPCAEAIRIGPQDQGAFGRIYCLNEKNGFKNALKIFKLPSKRSSSSEQEGCPWAASRTLALVELFHLLRCRDLEQVCRVRGYALDQDDPDTGHDDISTAQDSSKSNIAHLQGGVEGLVLEYLNPEDGWLTIAAASTLRDLRGNPSALVQQVGVMMRGLFEMHRRGIVHRDIQSENVMVNVSQGYIGCPAKFIDLGNSRSIDGTGLKALETKYCGEMLKAMPLEETSGWNRVESALAYAEFYGARDTLQTKLSRASATGSGSANMSSAGGRLYTSRRRDGCMWMRMRRRRAGKQDYNRFLDVLVKLQPGEDCCFAHPERIDQYALGIVVYEYIGSLIEGGPVLGPPQQPQQSVVSSGNSFAVSGTIRNKTEAGWIGCLLWQKVVAFCCSEDVMERRPLRTVLAFIEKNQ